MYYYTSIRLEIINKSSFLYSYRLFVCLTDGAGVPVDVDVNDGDERCLGDDQYHTRNHRLYLFSLEGLPWTLISGALAWI